MLIRKKRQGRMAHWVWTAASVGIFIGLNQSSAHATDILWNVQDGNWNVPGNWNPAGPPGAADAAQVKFAGVGNPTAHVTTDVGTVLKVAVGANNKVSIEDGGILSVNGGTDGTAGG